MRLVECVEENNQHQQHSQNIYIPNVRDEEISSPRPLQNMDNEMKKILADTTIDINQKCLLYHQVLQRYLGFIKRMHGGHIASSDTRDDESGKDPSNCESFNSPSNARGSRLAGVRRASSRTATSTPKLTTPGRTANRTSSTTVFQSLSQLPIRIRKQILRREKRLQQLKKTPSLQSTILSNDTTALTETFDDDDDDLYEDVIDEQSRNTTFGGVVNGWTESNIKK